MKVKAEQKISASGFGEESVLKELATDVPFMQTHVPTRDRFESCFVKE
jgi:hypothetical protein